MELMYGTCLYGIVDFLGAFPLSFVVILSPSIGIPGSG
eukprot:SAG31_NODE_66_length_28567_cov_30.222698_2_plen_38_part_00